MEICRDNSNGRRRLLTQSMGFARKFANCSDDMQKVFSSRKSFYSSHDAGVTSILPVSDSLVLTGSYDNHLRLFDYRNFRRPVCSVDLDGGVWRIFPRPRSNLSAFLTCCMQTGAKTVSLNLGLETIEERLRFEPEEERRLIYGASWQDEDTVVLCSFYEKNLYVCRIP